ncbi:acetylxylan esterase [Persicitalea jodogahamensis]|uniref:Cephalosporin deacetylase n=1 Tax=Persicitalea jodogahamensis TaxID=402147 RepID=A0A8J3D6G2_9BACT|nr:acetylxylan esterase [Persicitalea jodogahamensis]GHB59999.1 cephalosporin deacetylase [Persicitalea jodogahamensis]
MKFRFLPPYFLALFLVLNVALAQPAERFVKVIVAPDHADWAYTPGDKVKFTISVLKSGNPVKGAVVRYEVGPEKMPATAKETKTLANGTLTVDGGTMKSPGFLRCIAIADIDGVEYRGLGTAGFGPEQIKPTAADPADFDQFWTKAKEDLAKIPLDAEMTLLPDRCTETVNVYHVNLRNFQNSRLYGVLSVPKKEGKYPALLHVPGAGVRAYYGDVNNAEKGVITLQIGIHGVPVTMDPEVYDNLRYGALNGYQNFNLDDKDQFYYKRVYLGCVRANDFLTSLPQFDGRNLAVTGGSQGGALSIITAALDGRVKWLGAFYPALSDVTGYLHGRAGGWPHYFATNSLDFNNKKDKIATTGYYDVVNFARRVKIPGQYSWGFNDETCPPTSMYAAYNVISAPKSLYLALDTGHWTYPEQRDMMNDWLLEHLKGKE